MEYNKLIAEFMGLDIISLEQFLVGVQSTIARIKIGRKDYICPMVEGYLLEHLQYHTSWNWLMPVVEKCLIGEAEQSEEISNTTIKNIYEGICNQDISFAYQSVVEFIKFYNEQNQ